MHRCVLCDPDFHAFMFQMDALLLAILLLSIVFF